MQIKIPPLWKVCLVLVGVPAAWLVIWLVVAKVAGVAVSSGSEVAGLLSAIGGIMGTIFTVGGLLIGLVAVLSQITLEDRAQRLMEKKFDELAPELERRADSRIAGRIAFRDAQEAIAQRHWHTAEALIEETLERYPDLPHVRSTLAVALADEVSVHFAHTLQGGAGLVDIWQITQQPERFSEGAPIAKAIEWLRDAMRHEDNPHARVTARQALMYGYTADYDKMIAALEETVDLREELRVYLMRPTHLALLVHACHNEPARIRRVGQILGITLPVPQEQVVGSIKAVNFAVEQKDHVDWYALEVRLGQPSSTVVSTLRLFVRDTNGEGREAHAYVFSQNKRSYTFPAPPDDQASVPEPTLPCEELVRQLSERFLFICPYAPTAEQLLME